ncbi:BRO-N domain-containing protein [Clostridium brassicae]|uniref:Bro-N domain-containing protein n=1 Tax=Clostridium brassicae TaxID=2999072 RepID=A0ABT4D6H2_9CLOT|nr:Bro-N domain-containing protein [Clostridium brassicae]MCY6957892.1 Bro-N domain-containing protein [Clostridium brassicae]
MSNNLMVFENNNVEVFELNGKILFNPYNVGKCLELSESRVRDYLASMNEKQCIKLTNSIVGNADIRKLHNTGEKFLTESGVYKLIFKSNKPNAEKFQDWVTDEVLPTLRKEGAYITEKANPNMLRKKANEIESTQTINEALNIVLPILQKAKVSPESLALTTKEFYKKAGINLPIDINAEEHYLTVTDLAEYCGMYTKNDKPATQALSCILKEIPIADSEKKIVWEQKGNWQGSTVKYKKSLIDKIAEWVGKHGFPTKIKTDKRTYTVKYEQMNIYKKFA